MKSERPVNGTEDFGPPKGTGALSSAGNHVPRKKRERALHREEVLRAAENLLSKKSYGQISVQEIAEAAEFSVGYLYRLFSSKEVILESLLRIKHEELTGLLHRHLSEPAGAEERLRNLVQGVFSWLNDNPAYTSSSLRELLLLSSILPGFAAEHAMLDARYVSRMKSFFLEAQREGVFGEEDPEIMGRTLRALMKGFVLEDLFHGRENMDWTEYTPVVLRVFMRAFGPEGGRR